MTKLSPAAEAVHDAFWSGHEYPDSLSNEDLAAALRAAAEIVAPISYEDIWTDGRLLQYEKDDPVRNKLLAIATELDQLP